VDRIVVDSTAEIIRLAALTPRLQRVLIQVTPGGHGHLSQGAATAAGDQEFGFSLRSAAAADAVRRVLSHPELTLTGLYCDLAAPLAGWPSYEAAARELLDLMAAVREHTGVTLTELNLGGGPGAPSAAGDDDAGLADFSDRVRRVIASECAQVTHPDPQGNNQ
jgi:diaminopimelate decarboxylase